MEIQDEIDYYRIAEAIDFFKKNFKTQPQLEEIARHINLSPFHFQRMFQEWAGVSPKKFLQYLSASYAKKIIQGGATLFEAAYETGLSGTSRLHDLFIKLEGMTPGEYKNGGAGLHINYSLSYTLFGKIIIASTENGICYMAFADESEEDALLTLKESFPQAHYTHVKDALQENALQFFNKDWNNIKTIKLHLKASTFQLNIWQTLLKVPMGALSTYANLAKTAGYPGASRAVGTAVANNPIAFLIPCHRVIKSSGEIGQYHWGSARKNALIAWEAAITEQP